MGNYIFRRLALMLPTLFGIMLINFVVVQAAPGGPVEQMIYRMQHANIGGVPAAQSDNHAARGIPPEIIERIQTMYGFDKPAHERFWIMLKNYVALDFGESFYRNANVLDLIIEKLPVSISLGLWSTLLIYLISIPLGIRKAVSHGSHFDVLSSTIVSILYAIPGFLLGILLIVVFAGGTYFDWFPLRGLTSSNFDELSLLGKIADYFWHLALPLTAYTIGGFATLTMLTKNSFLDEINKQYVVTAQAKGLSKNQVLYRHVFRNAMLIIISGFPAAFISIFFAGSLLIEVIFSLDGLGLLSFEAVTNRDYPVFFGTLFIFTLLGLFIKLISDLVYVWVDPRIDFQSREH
ncbi:MAG TPA: microcin C ABC transporter permease YejB [Cellvibrio sp.]|nr:microcin C ABC transporter permease YejB [Cellvibrio sp.]